MIVNVYRSRCKVPVFSCHISISLVFSGQGFRSPHILNFMKIRPVRAELFHADGQTDMTKLTVAFRNFAKGCKTRWLLVLQ